MKVGVCQKVKPIPSWRSVRELLQMETADISFRSEGVPVPTSSVNGRIHVETQTQGSGPITRAGVYPSMGREEHWEERKERMKAKP
jgi:hypothetical protein